MMVGRALNWMADRTVSRWLMAALLVVLVLFPWAMGDIGRYYTVLLMTVFIFATLGHAWNLLAGFCGLLSFGIQVYVGLAGFSVAILQYYFNVPVWWAMLFSIVVTTLFAWLQAVPISGQHGRRNTWIGVIVAVILWAIYEIVIAYQPSADIFGGAYIRRVILLFAIFLGALPLLKLQGAYFAVATWLIAAAVASIFNEWRVVGAGGGMNIANDTSVMGRYYAGLLLLVVATGVVWWLLHSRYGQALTAVRDDEEAAMAVGIDIRLIKTMVFLISAPMAGLAAALYYIDAVTITPPDAFHIRWSAYAVFVVVAGGMGTLTGPIIGAIAFIFLQRFLVGLWGGGDLTLGIAAVLLILLLPRGIAGWLGDLRAAAARSGAAGRNGSGAAATPGAVVSATLMPSSPALHLSPGTPAWQGLRQGLRSVAGNIALTRPDTLVLLTNSSAPETDGRPVPRLTGQLSDPVYASFGDIGFDITFDLALAQALGEAGLKPHLPARADALVDGGAVAALAQVDPTHHIPVVIVHLGAMTPQDAVRAGQIVARAARDLGRRVGVIGLSGLSDSTRPVDVLSDPGNLASAQADMANRQILGWLQTGDAASLRQELPRLAGQAGIENHGAVLMALTGLARGQADILSYGAIFGSGAAVVSFEMRGAA